MTDHPAPEPDSAPAAAGDVDALGYAEAMAELEAILHDLEDGDVDIDHLAGQVRRAAELVRHCRGRLVDARTEVTRIVAELDEADAAGASGPLAGAAPAPEAEPPRPIDRS